MRTLYDWKNLTENKQYFNEDKTLLNNQRIKGDNCVMVTIHIDYSKKQMRKNANRV